MNTTTTQTTTGRVPTTTVRGTEVYAAGGRPLSYPGYQAGCAAERAEDLRDMGHPCRTVRIGRRWYLAVG